MSVVTRTLRAGLCMNDGARERPYWMQEGDTNLALFPWIDSYPAGVRWDAPVSSTPVPQLLDDAAEKWPDSFAIDFMGKKMTYRELLDLANRAAKGFQRLGVGPGIHVGLYLPNTPHYIISFFGVLKAGGTVVNYSPLDAEKTLQHKIEDSETDVLVTLDLASLLPHIEHMLHHTRLKTLVVGSLTDMAPDHAPLDERMLGNSQAVPWTHDAAHISFSDLLQNDGAFVRHAMDELEQRVAVLQYTGGTTGLPKGAILTHANLSAACAQYRIVTSGNPPTLVAGKERVLSVLPPFHIYSLAANTLFGISIGAELVLHVRFDVKAVVEDLEKKAISVFPGVPTMFTAVCGFPGIENVKLTSLRFCTSGGAPLPVELFKRFHSLTGCNLTDGWGMTETTAAGTFSPKGKEKPGACGIPLPGVRIRFADLDDVSVSVPLGEPGEICVSGPNIMKGYWNNPESSATTMTPDGYLRTGDVGYMDEDGYVHIIDRTKDMLLCGGYNVYPRIIEEAIYEHPSVAEVSVIGIDDEYRGQSPKAFVTLKSGAQAFTLEELKTFLKDRLGKHEMVHALEIRAELPKTPVGKLSKKELYEEEKRKHAGVEIVA
jgi:long-chain acyl-CoA synthetase